jgi:hypothetical protein
MGCRAALPGFAGCRAAFGGFAKMSATPWSPAPHNEKSEKMMSMFPHQIPHQIFNRPNIFNRNNTIQTAKNIGPHQIPTIAR